MADQFLAEIRIFAGTFAPTGWAMCNGQLLPISQNTALFALLGTYYGGDGKSTFALPNLQGAAPMMHGDGIGLTPRYLGESGGSETVTLITSEIPFHTHVPQATLGTGTLASPSGASWSGGGRGRPAAYAATPNVQMHPLALTPTGGSAPHNNLPPYLVMNFIIALQGIFPPRS